MQEHTEIYLRLCFLPEEKQPICNLWGEYFLLNFCIINSVILKSFQTPHFHIVRLTWQAELHWSCSVSLSLEFKSPWILGQVLKKSLNSIFPWKVLENWGFVFFNAFWQVKWIKFWISEMKNVENLVEQSVQVLSEWTGSVRFV